MNQHPVKRDKVKSSNIASVGFCAACNHIYVEFKDKQGNPTSLYKVPATALEHAALMTAPSVGTYYYQHFKSRNAIKLNN